MMLFLWLAYLLSDATAIYALGHLSLRRGMSRQQQQLVAFWAPFLLVHLGGPDTITAYAIEDNQLWLRHLLTLVVQAVGVAYVLYEYTADSANLALAAILMFVVGVIKYGERTWALKCGSLERSGALYSRKGGIPAATVRFRSREARGKSAMRKSSYPLPTPCSRFARVPWSTALSVCPRSQTGLITRIFLMNGIGCIYARWWRWSSPSYMTSSTPRQR
jgi:hypothetical protein